MPSQPLAPQAHRTSGFGEAVSGVLCTLLELGGLRSRQGGKLAGNSRVTLEERCASVSLLLFTVSL